MVKARPVYIQYFHSHSLEVNYANLYLTECAVFTIASATPFWIKLVKITHLFFFFFLIRKLLNGSVNYSPNHFCDHIKFDELLELEVILRSDSS